MGADFYHLKHKNHPFHSVTSEKQLARLSTCLSGKMQSTEAERHSALIR